jgi:hypothetical protein
MNEEPALSLAEDDLSDLCLGECLRLDSESIAGPQGWQHARTRDSNANRAALLEYFCGEAATAFLTGTNMHEKGQDLFRLKRHWPWLPCIFPQANASVSKTRS